MKMILKTILALCAMSFYTNANAQTAPFSIVLEPMDITGLGGLQSYAYGQSAGKWLIVGGRLDGLHQRQPFASFDLAGHNNMLIVIDPVTQQKWSAPLSSLSIALQEQLSSTNMNFHQEGDYLYCIGGYGYSATLGDHTTFANLTAIHVADVINAIIADTDFTSSIRQISDPAFQVTGGHLKKIYDMYYLLGGQKFIGRYNPIGPDHGPGFVQEYTNQIRRFHIMDDGTSIMIHHEPSYTDTAQLHRRDYNAEAQILSDGQEGITMFSGVFQYGVDLPFLNSVTVDSSHYAVDNTFQQYYNHYHCAVLPLYSAAHNEMHTVFFGGIAQYYDSLGILVQDNNVPFVKTIARVTRDASGQLAEYKLPVEMPVLMGAGAEFIMDPNIAHYNNEVIKLDEISTTDSTLVGYIYGGISSTAANIFWVNDGSQSTSNSQIYKVYLVHDPLAIHDLNEQGIGTLKMMVYPVPNNGNFIVHYNLQKEEDVNITITDLHGKVIEQKTLKNQSKGEKVFERKIRNLEDGGIYFITIETSSEKATQKIIIEP